jgi:hypothetical protein
MSLLEHVVYETMDSTFLSILPGVLGCQRQGERVVSSTAPALGCTLPGVWLHPQSFPILTIQDKATVENENYAPASLHRSDYVWLGLNCFLLEDNNIFGPQYQANMIFHNTTDNACARPRFLCTQFSKKKMIQSTGIKNIFTSAPVALPERYWGAR